MQDWVQLIEGRMAFPGIWRLAERFLQMSIEESIQYLEVYDENFAESVRKKKGATLDYAPHSLVLAPMWRRTMHRAIAANLNSRIPGGDILRRGCLPTHGP